MSGENFDGVDFSAQFAGEKAYDVPEEYGEIAFAIGMAFEQAFGKVPVHQVGKQARTFGIRKEALVLDGGGAFGIKAGLYTCKGLVPVGAETDGLGEKFVQVACTFERCEWVALCYPERRVEPFAERRCAVGKNLEDLLPFVKHLVPDFFVIFVQFVFGFVDFFGDELERTFSFEQEPCRFFAAEPEAPFHDISVDLHEPRVFPAYVAEGAFAKVPINFAEIVLV